MALIHFTPNEIFCLKVQTNFNPFLSSLFSGKRFKRYLELLLQNRAVGKYKNPEGGGLIQSLFQEEGVSSITTKIWGTVFETLKKRTLSVAFLKYS